MNGKDYVNKAIDVAGNVLTGVGDAGVFTDGSLLEDARKACEELNGMKNKPSLRTKEGANLAFPVFDAAQNLEEAWEDAQDTDELDDLKWRLEGFADAVMAFAQSLKDKTVIMT
ncbi:MAG: hypothetical protein R6U50_06760 [Desulfobacterales bacterium]